MAADDASSASEADDDGGSNPVATVTHDYFVSRRPGTILTSALGSPLPDIEFDEEDYEEDQESP